MLAEILLIICMLHFITVNMLIVVVVVVVVVY